MISLIHIAAIVKGLVEHNDGTRHFGSTIGYKGHMHDAVALGVVTQESQLTEKGLDWYKRCLVDLPQGRANNWQDVGEPASPHTQPARCGLFNALRITQCPNL